MGSLCRCVALAYPLLIPLQDLVTWRTPLREQEDQRQSLALVKTSLLSQLQAAVQRARVSIGGQEAGGSGSVAAKALDPAKLLALGKGCLRVVLLSAGLCPGLSRRRPAQRQCAVVAGGMVVGRQKSGGSMQVLAAGAAGEPGRAPPLSA